MMKVKRPVARDVRPRDWTRRAACLHADPELFFPEGAGPRCLDQVRLAKKWCASCPVLDDCLIWAVSTGECHGVWGGTTPDERRLLRLRARTTARVRVRASGGGGSSRRDIMVPVMPSGGDATAPDCR
jgi:WhiB family redox-sensing transcriptional regulator